MTPTTRMRLAAVSAVASLLCACDGRHDPVAFESGSAPSAPRAQTAASSTAGGQRLAQALALALGDAAARAQLRNALRGSPWNEHKLVLGDYAATPEGQRLVAAAAAAAGVAPATVLDWIAAAGPMDFYLPLQPQRQSWAGSDNLVVGLNLDDDDPTLTGYAPDGSVVHLDARNGVPSRVVILLAPAEPKVRRVDAHGGAGGTATQPGTVETMAVNGGDCGPTAVTECNVENGGATGPTRVLQSFVPYVADGWGQPELTIIHWDTNPLTGELTNQVWNHAFGGSPVGVRNYVNEPTTFGFYATVVEVRERDGWFTFNDDYWGTGNLAASGTATRIFGRCGTVYGDGYGQFGCSDRNDPVITADIWYVY
ncbi:MAG: hypothetical protein ACJ8GN_19860 [Longimicrobiaceae bacterium]